MFDKAFTFVLSIFALFFLIAPFAVNAFYQRKAARYTDELLAENNAEFNWRVRINAVILSVRRSLWGLFVLSGVNFRSVLKGELHWLTVIFVLIGVGCFAFGAWGYKNELKHLKTLE